jgi:clan AA aspartic protease
MITGKVRNDEARIRLKVRGPRGTLREVLAVIDTGYTGSLTLSPAIISSLGLVWRSVDRATLADGSECLFDVYEGTVVWDRRVRPIVINQANAEPMVGMTLLRGFELRMQVRPRGKVTISRTGP